MVPLVEALKEEVATLKLIRDVPEIAVYGFLLSTSSHDSLAEMVKQKWMELHALTGKHFLLVVFQAPDHLENDFKVFWEKRLGDSFSQAWKDWKKPGGDGRAFNYLESFEPKLKPSQLPCLVLFTDPEARKAIIRPIPDWDVDSLYQLFIGISEAAREASEQPKDNRLQFLEQELTSFSGRAGAYLGYVKEKTAKYVKKHPAKVVATTIGVALALATGNVLPLAPAVIAVLTELKNTVK
jgi:hypothetical protein